MNLLARRIWLPMSAAIFLFSCEDPGEIGFQDSVPNPFEVNYIDLPLNPKVAYLDSVNSTNASTLMFGSYLDPNFGLVQSTAYMELQITENDYEIPETAEFDSLVLFMDITYAYGPTPGATMFLEARSFDGQIETNIYFTKDSIETPLVFGPTSGLLGARTRAYDSESDKTFYFKLSESYGEQLLSKMITDVDSTFRVQNYFRTYLTGLKVFSTNVNGGIFGFDPISDSTRMSLFYHFIDSDGEQVDMEHQFTLRRGFSNVRADFTGTAFETLGPSYSDFDPGDGLAYYNPALGLFLKVDLTSLYNFRDTATNVILNRADLIVEIDNSIVNLSPPQEIRYYQINSENRFVLSDISFVPRSIQIESPNLLFIPTLADDPFEFVYDSDNNKYSEQVTFYVKNILSEKLSDSSMVILPLAPARDGTKADTVYYPRINSVDQFVVPKNNVKLRLYYSKFE